MSSKKIINVCFLSFLLNFQLLSMTYPHVHALRTFHFILVIKEKRRTNYLNECSSNTIISSLLNKQNSKSKIYSFKPKLTHHVILLYRSCFEGITVTFHNLLS